MRMCASITHSENNSTERNPLPPNSQTVSDRQKLVIPGEVRIIRKDELPSVHNVLVDGKEYLLGDHRDFYRHPYLAEFIPQKARLGIAWVRLKVGEVLETHVHPIESMILICDGEAEFRGDVQSMLSAGDIVAVPRGARHGFRGAGQDGFHGLSIQFEQRGLYEDIDHALVSFLGNKQSIELEDLQIEQCSFEKLIQRNELHKQRFHDNLLFRMMSAGCFSDISVKQKFLDYFQIWSNQFQKAVLLRSALCDDPIFASIFRKHLMEELNHDLALNRDRNGTQARWDAVLAATSTWFPNKMLTTNHYEQIVIMHLCVEAVAVVFYKFACPALDPENKMAHFRAHDGVDEAHERLGIELLESLSKTQYHRLVNVQSEAWGMSEALFSRLGELVQIWR